MKKVIFLVFSLIVLLIVADLGASYYVGLRAKQRFEQLVTFLNNNHLMTYEIISYHQGLLKSEAITQVKFKYIKDSNKYLKVKHTLLHGPIIIGGSVEKPVDFQLAVVNSQPIDLSPQVNVPFTTQTIFKFNQETETKTIGTAVTVLDPLFQISSPGWSSNTQINKHWQAMKGNIIIPEMTIQVMALPIVIKDIQLLFDQNRSDYGNWLGEVSLNVGNALQQEQGIEIANLKFKENVLLEPKSQVMAITWNVDFNKVAIAKITYGPLHFALQLENIDPEALKLLSDFQNNISIDRQKQEEFVKKVLSKKPKLTITPSEILLPEGKMQIETTLTIGDANIGVPLEKENLMKTLDGNLHAIVPKEILRQGLLLGMTQEMQKDPDFQKMTEDQKKQALDQQLTVKIQKLVQDGVLTEKGTDYEIKISVVKGKWIVNGKELSL